MSDQAEVKRVRMSLQDVSFNLATKQPIATLVLEIPLEDVVLEQGYITPIFKESWEKGGKTHSRTIVARIGDRFGKVYKDLESLDPSLKGYRLKVSLIAPEVSVQTQAKPVVQDDTFGAPIGGMQSQETSSPVGGTTTANGKKTIRASQK